MFSDDNVDLLYKMTIQIMISTFRVFMLTCQNYVDLSDNFVVICKALTGQGHVLRSIF